MSDRILVVDDDRSIRETFQHHLGRTGYEVRVAASAEEALSVVAEFEPALVITDLRMPGLDGLALLERLKAGGADADVLVITAHDDMASAVAAMKAGAYDYLVKPLDLDRIEATLAHCLHQRALRRHVHHLATAAAEPFDLQTMVGRDPRMIEIYKLIGMLSGNRATVLIRGETGTGKERIARAIHFNSPQAAEPFIAVNCTALSETLLESELFGHVRGAFTGAVASRRGCFELAGTGTVFLDEIGDTSPELQAKLLRVLENREFYPVGGEQARRSEARIITATHQPLEQLIQSGQFREDLYFRLRVVEITVPPLRERPSDIPELVEHLIGRLSRELHRDPPLVTRDAMEVLQAYHWPGNVRELENTLTRALVLARGPAIAPEHLQMGAPDHPGPASAAPAARADTLDAVEREHLCAVLERTGWNKRRAAHLLGVTRPRLDRLIARHGLTGTKRDTSGHEA